MRYLLCLFLVACTGIPVVNSALDGDWCAKDTDCKADRICVAGACADPSVDGGADLLPAPDLIPAPGSPGGACVTVADCNADMGAAVKCDDRGEGRGSYCCYQWQQESGWICSY